MWRNLGRSVLNTKPKQNMAKKSVEKPENKLSQAGSGSSEMIMFGGSFGGGINQYGPDVGEITYFTVLRIFSETMGKLPVNVRDKDHNIVYNDVNYRLNKSPNMKDNPSNLFSFLEYCRIHYGNGYAYCEWGRGGKLVAIHPLNPCYVRIWIDDTAEGIGLKHYYSYTMPTTGVTYMLDPSDVLHVKTWHLDERMQMVGIPVRETLHEYMVAAMAGQKTQNDLYTNGMIANGVLNYVGDLSDQKKALILEQTKKFGKTNKVIPLPKDWTISKLDLSLSDSQYLETRKFTALQIAAAFGISPNQLNDYSKATYSNATAQEVAFLTGAMLYISRIYEDELSRKLLTRDELDKGMYVDINVDALLKNTPDQLSTMLCNYVKSSIMTINEARSVAGLPAREDGDKLLTMPGAGIFGQNPNTNEVNTNDTSKGEGQ